MDKIITRIGSVSAELDVFNLKDVLVKNDAGDWGDEPKEDAIGIIRSTNFTNEGMLDLKDVAYRSLKPNKRLEKKLFENEILIERSGGSETQPVGRVGLVTNEIGSSDFAFANFIQRIALNETVEPNYVYYCLQQMYEMGITRAMQYQTTGIRNLDWKLYTKSVLPKPPKPEQTAIATILSKVDEAIATTKNSIKAAEKLKKALMQNLLTGKLKPDGSWRKEDEFYETKVGRLPVDWKLVKTKDFCEKVTDGTHDTPKPNNTGFPLVTSKNLKSNGVDFDDCYLISEQDYIEINKRSQVYQYDILFGMIGTVGNPQIVTQNPVEFAIKNVGLFRMNGNEKLSIWLKNYLDSDIFRIYKQKQQAGTTQQFVSLGFLRKIPVPIPMNDDEINYSVIDEVNKKIIIADNELISKQTKINTLQRLKKSLMQNLLTGKVRLDVEKVNKILSEQAL